MARGLNSAAVEAPDYAEGRAQYLKAESRPQRGEYIHSVRYVQARQMEVQAGFAEIGEKRLGN
ncbi:MAG TPA: hypothetical protein VIH18_30690 [Candidatus Binatia bacterium]